jgi:hypothetical protein
MLTEFDLPDVTIGRDVADGENRHEPPSGNLFTLLLQDGDAASPLRKRPARFPAHPDFLSYKHIRKIAIVSSTDRRQGRPT